MFEDNHPESSDGNKLSCQRDWNVTSISSQSCHRLVPRTSKENINGYEPTEWCCPHLKCRAGWILRSYFPQLTSASNRCYKAGEGYVNGTTQVELWCCPPNNGNTSDGKIGNNVGYNGNRNIVISNGNIRKQQWTQRLNPWQYQHRV